MSTSRTLRWPASAVSRRLPDQTVKNSLRVEVEGTWEHRVVSECGNCSGEGSEEGTAGGWSRPVPAVSARVAAGEGRSNTQEARARVPPC